ncbi:hypothetical protein Tco_0213867 [Tanacetum coccineum]
MILKSLILKCGDTPTISYDNFEFVKRIDLIDATCAEYAPKVLDFTESGDSTSIISDPPSFTPFKGSEMILEEEIEEWILLLQEFNLEIRDKKGAENVAADHLSRLENPHKSELEKKDITESFPLESLGKVEEVKEINVNDNVLNENENVVENNVLNNVNMLSDNTTPWFADLANYHAGNFVKKGMSSQQKKKFFKDAKHYYWDDP